MAGIVPISAFSPESGILGSGEISPLGLEKQGTKPIRER